MKTLSIISLLGALTLSACGSAEEGMPQGGADERTLPQVLSMGKGDIPEGIRLVGELGCENDATQALSGRFRGWGWDSAHQYRLMAWAKTRYAFHFKVNYAPGGGAAIAVYDVTSGDRLALAREAATDGQRSYTQQLTFTAKADGELRIAVYATTQYAYGAYALWLDCEEERSCDTVAESQGCDAQPHCQWDRWSERCEVAQCSRIYGSDCDATSHCQQRTWVEQYYLGKMEKTACESIYASCADIPNQQLCVAESDLLHRQCAWINGACAESCNSRALGSFRGAQKECENHPECTWVVRDGEPTWGVAPAFCTEKE